MSKVNVMRTGMTYNAVVTTTIRLRFSFDSISIRLSFDVERQSNDSCIAPNGSQTASSQGRIAVVSNELDDHIYDKLI